MKTTFNYIFWYCLICWRKSDYQIKRTNGGGREGGKKVLINYSMYTGCIRVVPRVVQYVCKVETSWGIIINIVYVYLPIRARTDVLHNANLTPSYIRVCSFMIRISCATRTRWCFKQLRVHLRLYRLQIVRNDCERRNNNVIASPIIYITAAAAAAVVYIAYMILL